MYSRNMRYGKRAQPMSFGQSDSAAKNAENSVNTVKNTIPSPPPNYRGMIYDTNVLPEILAEGIDRLAREDESYKEYEKDIRKRELRLAAKQNESVLAASPNVEFDRKGKNTENQGLHRLINGLSESTFSAEDILICAMIILMLNSSSEDDMLMVLVLMMLL